MEETMEKTFRYRRFNIVLIRISIGLEILLGLLLGVLSFAGYPSMAIVAGVLLLEAVWIGKFAKRLSSTEVKLTEEGLSYSNHHRTVFLKYEEITKIDSRSVNFAGGWFNVLSASNKPIRLTITLQGVGELILILKERMDANGLSDRYDHKKLFNFFRTATYGDQSWERGRHFMIRFLITLVVQMVLMILIIINYEMPESRAIFYISSIFLGIIPFLYYEFGVYARAYKKIPVEDNWKILPSDPDLDRKRTTMSYIFFLLISTIGLLAAWLL
jgi:hypothetical protein